MEQKYPQIFSKEIPKAENIIFEPLLQSYKKLLYIENSLIFIALLSVLTISYFLIDSFLSWLFLLVMSLLILGFLFIIILISLGFKYKGYAIGEKDIHYKSGYLVKNITSVPIKRIQHMKIQQGVFSKALHLAKIEIYTAGDDSGDLTINGISLERAKDIKTFIGDKIK